MLRRVTLPWLSLGLVIPSVTVGVFGLLAFILEYTGRGEYLTRYTLALLFVESILATVVVLTDGRRPVRNHVGQPSTTEQLSSTLL